MCREITERLAGEIVFLQFAGTDTTAYAMTRAALYLAEYPEWHQELWQEQQELMAEYGDTIDRRVRPPPRLLPVQYCIYAYLTLQRYSSAQVWRRTARAAVCCCLCVMCTCILPWMLWSRLCGTSTCGVCTCGS